MKNISYLLIIIALIIDLGTKAQDAGHTPTVVDVAENGAFTYSVPVSVPPGVRGIEPRIAITYNSQSGNGVAGYGWNISGSSVISRVGTTKFHDGKVGGINLDSQDRFAIDGMRLVLKSGTYGGDGAEYQTEIYSNNKISSHGVSPFGIGFGPSYFQVIYPDGSKAIYGNSSDSRSKLFYALTYTEDPQGLRINYSYNNLNNTLTLKQIDYGAKSNASQINSIKFTYKDQYRKEDGFIAGEWIYKNALLTKVEVWGNGSKFREYILTHDKVTYLVYDRLKSIQEFSGDGAAKYAPITFNYSDSQINSTSLGVQTMSLGNVTSQNSQIHSTDINGNGNLDVILYPANINNRNKLYAFFDLSQSTYAWADEVNVGNFTTVLSSNFITSDGKLSASQGLVVIKEPTNTKVKMEIYVPHPIAAFAKKFEKEFDGHPATSSYYSPCLDKEIEGSKLPKEYFSGDFDGDGLIDVISINKEFTAVGSVSVDPDPNCRYGSNELIDPRCCIDDYYTISRSFMYLYNMDQRKSNDLAYVGELTRTFAYHDKVFAIELNGDNKTDILHISNGVMYAYSLSPHASGIGNRFELLWAKTEDSRIKSTNTLIGDYNGDGNMDVMFTTTDRDEFGKTVFALFYSTGKGFVKHEKYYDIPVPNYRDDGKGRQDIWSLFPNDMNGDGKTDFVYTHTTTYNGSSTGSSYYEVWDNMGPFNSQSGAPSFKLNGSALKMNGVNLIHFPIQIFLNSDKPNYNREFGYMSGNSVSLFSHQKDLRNDVIINSVTQNGITHNVEYKTLTPDDNGDGLQIYTADNKQVYPSIDIANAVGFKVVSKVTRSYNQKQVQQVFAYKGAVTNSEGLGFLGFSELVRSNWYQDGDNSNVTYNIYIKDPNLRGAVSKSFNSKNVYLSSSIKTISPPKPFETRNTHVVSESIVASESITLLDGFTANGSEGAVSLKVSNPAIGVVDNSTISDYITRTDYTYETRLSTNKVFTIIPTSITMKDKLSGVNKVTTYTYDSFNNVTREHNNFSGTGTKTTEVQYSNNTGSPFYIGRAVKRKSTFSNANDVSTSEEEFSYTNYLTTQIKKKGHNTSYITEDLEYDNFGNVTKKTITAGGVQRSAQTYFDVTGRFPVKSIDVEGLETTSIYNSSTGTLTSSTDPFNHTTSYLYDTWGRPLQKTNYLGNKSYTSYSILGTDILISESDDEGRGKQTTIDALGKTTEIKIKDALGQWIGTSTEYDNYGRAVKVSEPSTGGYNQWNETEYDEYGRIAKSTSYTGKITNITYSGLSTTVNDGTKSVTTTMDALGNKVQLQDLGGTINYTYFANGNLKSSDYEGSKQMIEQDGWGRKVKLVDPSAGVYSYEYNDFGELIKEINPKGTTTYTYDSNGKTLTKLLKGDHTDMAYAYSYDGTTKLLNTVALTNSDGNNTSYSYTYDSDKRLTGRVEDNANAKFTKSFTYDSYGRISTETSEAKNKQNGKVASKTILNSYQYGGLKSISDNGSAEKIWEVDALNVRGQATSISLGANLKEYIAYDQYGLLQEMKTSRIGTNGAELMKLTFSFDVQRGILNSRGNTAFSWNESFTHDNLDRLTAFSYNNSSYTQTYDARGRISSNSQIGQYSYNGSSYQQASLTNITSEGYNWYLARPQQQISYNIFKSPVEIIEEGKENISFQYNGGGQRSAMYFGGTETNKDQRRYRKFYSEDGSMEILNDIQTNASSFVFYIGGDAYSAPAIWKEVHAATTTTQDLYYLHRDYLGSILMIADKHGNIKEKRQFDAWGNIVKLTDGNGNDLAAFVILDRGYTGHEHLLGAALIHMNGRLYDPKLHRFLSPDNYVQNLFDTQNFNRYGYVFNNPLVRIDSSGEFPWLIPIIAAAVMGTGNLAVQAANGEIHNFWDAAKAFGSGAIAGAAIGTGIGAGLGVPILGSAIKVTGILYTGTIIGSALGNTMYGIKTGDWSRLENTGKTVAGLFYLDSDRNIFGQALQGISRFSWEGLQTAAGHTYTQIRNNSGNVSRIDYFGGATFATRENVNRSDVQGVSLGNFLNLAIENKIDGDFRERVLSDPLYMHEYGHTFDSHIFGLSYLFAIGIPSAVGAEWTERRANSHASRYFEDFGVNWTPFVRRGYPLKR